VKKGLFAIVLVPMAIYAATLSAQTPARADAGTASDFGARARGAARVVVAAVADMQPRFDVNEYGDHLIITRTTLRVEETLKGTQTDLVDMDVEGGTIGDLTLTVTDLPIFHRGDRGVFFLESSSTSVHRLHGRRLGLVRLDTSDHALASTVTLADIRAAVRAAR
jgi:hypothetical protein